MMLLIKQYRWLIIFLLGLCCLRMFLITSGHLYWPDELRYINAFYALDGLQNGNFKKLSYFIFNAHGRPGYVLLSMIPATFQLIVSNAGWLTYPNPQFFDIPSAFNVLVTLGISFTFFAIAWRLFKNYGYALLATVVYSLLCNTNLYLRHMLPYDLSLLLFLLAMFGLLKDHEDRGLGIFTAFWTGMLSSLGFATCPSYYFFVILLALIVFIRSQKKLLSATLHIFSFLSIFGILEAFSRMGHRSYFENSRKLSGLVTQGSFEEGFVFLPKYLVSVEGMIGSLLLLLFVTFLIFLPKKTKSLKIIFGIVVFGYCFHAAMGVFFHKMVFYGRIMHMYFPFVVLGAVSAVQSWPNIKWKQGVTALTLLISLFSFSVFFLTYIQLSYPIDFRYKHLKGIPKDIIFKTSEIRPVTPFSLEKREVIAVNAEHLYPIPEEFIPIQMPSRLKLVSMQRHPLGFSAYPFEGYSVEERKRLHERQYQMKIYIWDKLYETFKKNEK